MGPVSAGIPGGSLVVAQRAEPRTLNPVIVMDEPSRTVLSTLHASLVVWNPIAQRTEPGLAARWTVAPGDRGIRFSLRPGLRFSDGHPCDAADVLFSIQVYLDEANASPQRSLLFAGGQPVRATQHGPLDIDVEFAAPAAAASRMFTGLAILPRHRLEDAWRAGRLPKVWDAASPPASLAGLGPFRLRESHPGERLVLERNPYYWERGRDGAALPYLERLEFSAAGSEESQIARFLAGEAGLIESVGPRNFDMLSRHPNARSWQLIDAGPSLDYNFLLFNLSPPSPDLDPAARQRRGWFADIRFRQAVSRAIDRDAIVSVVYAGHAAPLWGMVSPGNKLWFDPALPRPPRSLDAARAHLRDAGFRWDSANRLLDPGGHPVSFSIAVSSSSAERSRMAALIQEDLRQLGIDALVAGLEFRALIARVLDTHDYDTAVMGLGAGDGGPASEMSVLVSSGPMHLWNLSGPHPSTPWETQIDQLMRQQASEVGPRRRRDIYAHAQRILSDNVPMTFLASPEVLVAARAGLSNLAPPSLAGWALWNAAHLFWTRSKGASSA